jgi:hypothetical protein
MKRGARRAVKIPRLILKPGSSSGSRENDLLRSFGHIDHGSEPSGLRYQTWIYVDTRWRVLEQRFPRRLYVVIRADR